MTWQEKATFELGSSLVIFKTFFTKYKQVCKTEICDSPMSISLKPSLFTQLHIQCAEASYNYLYLRTLKLDRNTKFTYLSTHLFRWFSGFRTARKDIILIIIRQFFHTMISRDFSSNVSIVVMKLKNFDAKVCIKSWELELTNISLAEI